MPDRILVDTSAWIMSFRKTGNEALQDYLRKAVAEDKVVTTPIIILELLQGCKEKKEYERLKSSLEILPQYAFNHKTWATAYEMGFNLRKTGLTLPTIDIMIAALVKQNALWLLHHDRHFVLVQKTIPIHSVTFLDT